MSHYVLEIVIPPTSNVQEAIDQVLAPFNEQGEDEDGAPNTHTFWDWYVIGGRWAGRKQKAWLSGEALDAFSKKLSELGITVSGVQMGKPTLDPPQQREKVDALWRESFPDSGMLVCPIFDHYPQTMHDDICTLDMLPEGYEAERVIFAAPDYEGEKLEATHMTCKSFWNGVNHVDTQWDGTIAGARAEFAKRIENYKEDYQAKILPQGDWLVVTVDYHS